MLWIFSVMSQKARCSIRLLNSLTGNSLSTFQGRSELCFGTHEYILTTQGCQILSSSSLLLIRTRISLLMKLDYIKHCKQIPALSQFSLLLSKCVLVSCVCDCCLVLIIRQRRFCIQLLICLNHQIRQPHPGCPWGIASPHAHKLFRKVLAGPGQILLQKCK